jgi:tRNA1Val (adenine37-N6)-methyltransferase
MANHYFTFKQFTVYHDRCAFKVGTDGVLLGAAADIRDVKSVLDIGTGSGVIALMLAQRSDAEIVAIEPDMESYTQASENVKDSPWKTRINVLSLKIQDYSPENIKFDLVVSNPPFFSDSLKNPDPRIAAARHNDSLSRTELLSAVSRLLENHGKFQVIMPYPEGNILIAEAQEFGLYCKEILKIRPLPHAEIRRLIITFSRQRERITESFLTIEKGKRYEFTQEYMELTKDFYLKF